MSPRRHPRRRAVVTAAAVAIVTPLAAVSAQSALAADRDPTEYVGGPEVIRDGSSETADTLEGVVFDDVNKDSVRQEREKGLKGVAVSNGRDVVVTDSDGTYSLEVRDGDTVFVTKPAGWDTPVDDTNFAQFSYTHSPKGTEQELRYGGLKPTGKLPDAVNFPLAKNPSSARDDVTCAIGADVQTYNSGELGYARTGLVRDMSQREDLDDCGALFLGDFVGDDLSLYPRLKRVIGGIDTPIRVLPGNHDYDRDATSDDWSFDTYRQHIGPTTYSYDVGNLHFIALDNVRYPCTPEDNADGKHAFCNNPQRSPRYNGVLGQETLGWIEQDLANVDKDKTVVVATHIPLVAHADMTSNQHQTDDVAKLYELLEGRKALSLSGHTHSLENMVAGDSFAPWTETVGVQELPFQHLVAGAPAGDWYSGDLNIDGIPMTLQRDGAPNGYFLLDAARDSYELSFHAIGRDGDQMGLAVSSPTWREWFTAAMKLRSQHRGDRSVTAPRLDDPNLLTGDDLTGGSYLTANVWNSTTDSQVSISIDGGEAQIATLTQPAEGERMHRGADYADPYAATRQLKVPGFTTSSIADTMTHQWRVRLPTEMELGVHIAEVTWTDRYGNSSTERLAFEVVE